MPAMMSYWSELARDIVLPQRERRQRWCEHEDLTAVCQRQLIAGLRERLGPIFSCWNSIATTWWPTPSPTKSPPVIASADAADMAPMTDEQVEQVRSLVAAIPAGRVATYGDIAAVAGLSSPRIVGWIMRTDSARTCPGTG